MGIDFIRKAAGTFHKGLDRKRIELGTPDLFRNQLQSAPRIYVASIENGANLNDGDQLCVRLVDGNVFAMRGLTPVLSFERPTPELLNGLSESFGEGTGMVQRVHSLAGMVEITVW